MKILHITSSMNPAYGGLSACITTLIPALSTLGHTSEIVTLDQPDEPFVPMIQARVYALGPTILGFAYAPRLRMWLRANAERFDVVIVHGLWQYHGLATFLALCRSTVPRYFVFPHGMLDPWFTQRNPLKRIKKWLYWTLAEKRILRHATSVLFTCEEERRLARLTFAGSVYREKVVVFGTAAPLDRPLVQCEAFLERYPELRDRPYWLYLGRIHPKKGADLLIDAYAALTMTVGALPCLVMAGPCADAEYLHHLKSRASHSCPAGTIIWPGMLSRDVKWGALRGAEVFALPSHQENFGIAVVEALACGTPVLISDQVNISKEINADGAGLVEPDTAEGTSSLLARWIALDTQKRLSMRKAAKNSFYKRFEIGAAAQSLIDALEELAPTSISP